MTNALLVSEVLVELMGAGQWRGTGSRPKMNPEPNKPPR